MKKTILPMSLKKKIAARDNYTCQICGKIGRKAGCGLVMEYIETWLHGRESRTFVYFEIDHIVPEFLGGDSSEENLQLACRRCNRAKGYKLCL